MVVSSKRHKAYHLKLVQSDVQDTKDAEGLPMTRIRHVVVLALSWRIKQAMRHIVYPVYRCLNQVTICSKLFSIQTNFINNH